MAALTGLITVAEFGKIPDERIELRHGEVVKVPPPTMRHARIQQRTMLALHRLIGHAGYVSIEVAFRPLPEYEVWSADIAFVSAPRDKATGGDEWLSGAPDIVVEVLSPSNTQLEMDERRDICLENGSVQFWLVNPDRQMVGISTPDGNTKTYRAADQIDLAAFGGGKLPVADLFAE